MPQSQLKLHWLAPVPHKNHWLLGITACGKSMFNKRGYFNNQIKMVISHVTCKDCLKLALQHEKELQTVVLI